MDELCKDNTSKINKIINKNTEQQSDISYMRKAIDEVKSELKELRAELKENYASKWVEPAVKGFILLLVLGALFMIFQSAGLTLIY